MALIQTSVLHLELYFNQILILSNTQKKKKTLKTASGNGLYSTFFLYKPKTKLTFPEAGSLKLMFSQLEFFYSVHSGRFYLQFGYPDYHVEVILIVEKIDLQYALCMTETRYSVDSPTF